MGGWKQWYDKKDARRELGQALKEKGWDVDNSKPTDDIQTDYFPSTSWYPEWAKKEEYILYLDRYDDKVKTLPNMDKADNWFLVKNGFIVLSGRNYRPVDKTVERINEILMPPTSKAVATNSGMLMMIEEDPKIHTLMATMEDLRVNPMDTFTATFVKAKETKNTIMYQEEPGPAQPPRIGTLYVQKWVAGTTQKVKVTVEEVK